MNFAGPKGNGGGDVLQEDKMGMIALGCRVINLLANGT
jgi:hypothetical protein